MRVITAMAMTGAAMALLACAGLPGTPDAPPEDAPAVVAPPPADPQPLAVPQGIPSADPPTGPGERHPLTCCDTHTVHRVLEEYLDLHRALHEEAAVLPAAETYALRGVLKSAAADTSLPAAEREIVGELVDSLEGVKDGDLETVRGAFPAISRHLVFLVLAHEGGSREVAEAWCDQGPWLQEGEELASPWADKDCGRWR